MPFLERYLVNPSAVALALLLEPRIAGLRPFAFHALEEALERVVQVLQRGLADVRRDLVQPGRVRVLQLDKLLLQITQPRPLPRQLVLPTRLREAPVVDVPGRANALCEQHELRTVRVQLEPVCLLDDPPLRTHVRSLRTRPDPPKSPGVLRNRTPAVL